MTAPVACVARTSIDTCGMGARLPGSAPEPTCLGRPCCAARWCSSRFSHLPTASLNRAPPKHLMHLMPVEHCDRGSLLSAIKRGVFSMEGLPEDSGSPAAAGATAMGSAAGGIMASSSTAPGAGLQTSRTSVTAAMAAAGMASAGTGGGVEAGSPIRLSRRVVLRALLRTARDVAQVGGQVGGCSRPLPMLHGLHSCLRGPALQGSGVGSLAVTQQGRGRRTVAYTGSSFCLPAGLPCRACATCTPTASFMEIW